MDNSEIRNCINCHFYCTEMRVIVTVGELTEVEKQLRDNIKEPQYEKIEKDRVHYHKLFYGLFSEPKKFPTKNFNFHYNLCCYFHVWEPYKQKRKGMKDLPTEKVVENFDKLLNKPREDNECFHMFNIPGVSVEAGATLQERKWAVKQADKDRELTRKSLEQSKRSFYVATFVAMITASAFIHETSGIIGLGIFLAGNGIGYLGYLLYEKYH